MGILGQIRQKRVLEDGLKAFERDGQTPQDAFFALRWRHCDSKGRATDQLANRLAQARPRQQEPSTEGLLSAEHDQALAGLRADGFHVYQQKLPNAACAHLDSFARRTPAQPHPWPEGAPELALYNAEQPLCETYRFDEKTILTQPEVQDFVADASLRALARDYLHCEPIFDLAAMWWSAPTSKASSAAAQLYHFDMDRVHWLKFFVYLSEVTPSRGPHCYLKGTHVVGESSRKLLELGDRRIEDEEITALGLHGLEAEICGGVGTILVADTRGHHKGKPPLDGDRLLLQLEFANSLFGASYQKVDLSTFTPALRKAIEQAPGVFDRLRLSG